MILLGGPVFGPAASQSNPYLWQGDPAEWAHRVRSLGYGAAYAPVVDPADERISAFSAAASEAGIVIAEVGIWRNLISADERERRANIAVAQELLELAERLHASCAVTFAGTRGEGEWGWGPCDQNFSDDTFALIVDTSREVIDGVQPRHAKFAFETMQTCPPDSPESYAALVDAIDRVGFGVHFDPVNLITSPRVLAEQGHMIRRFVELLGERIVSCHAKDLRLTPDLLIHFDEVPPGEGVLDYRVFLSEIRKLPGSVPVMLEHLATEAEYAGAAAFLAQQLEQLE